MIEIKNVKQIGTPREDGKIYIENLAYSKLREDEGCEKKVYVLMGHTERMDGRYATFVEGVIPVNDAEFSGMVPRWNTSMWSQVFRHIKRLYEELIIVGWAIDVKGCNPALSVELERVHREHFGGVHQILLLMDSQEGEETFYIYKENKLVAKDGFYIYYKARTLREGVPEKIEVLDLTEETADNKEVIKGGRYRQLMMQEEKAESGGGGGLAIAVAVLVFLLMVGVYENKDSIPGFGDTQMEATEAGATESEKSEETGAEDGIGDGYQIPVEGISEN